MGAITSDFPNLPQDGDARRIRKYDNVYATLAGLGLSVPAQPADVITRAQLLAHLQGLVGQLVATEISNDPESLGYSGFTDEQIADAMHIEFPANVPNPLPLSNPLGYTITAATINGMQAEVTGGGDPGFDALKDSLAGIIRQAVYARFRNDTLTPVLRGQFVRLDDAPSSNQVTFAVAAPGVPPVGNTFDLSLFKPLRLPPRMLVLLTRIPYCPNRLTAADIAGARS